MRRLLSLLLWCAALASGGLAVAEETTIPALRDLRVESARITQQRTPMLLMFYADYCAYCMRMEREFLKPMIVSGAYREKALIRRVPIDGGFFLNDFDGKRITGEALAKRYGVTVTPTLIFLDSRGTELTGKMVGLTTPEYFGAYLDAVIELSLAKLRNRNPPTAVARSVEESCSPMC